MTNPVIDSNVPLPRRRNDYAVLDALEVGQSVWLPAPSTTIFSTAIAYRRARDGKQFTCRKEQNSVRIWRVQ